METSIKKPTALGDFIPFLTTFKKSWYLRVALLSAVIIFGLYAFFIQLIDGHIVTGMRDNVVWGVYIINFIFFLGLSYAGALISCIFHLGRINWGKPLIRMLEIMAVTSLIVGPIYIILCIGRPDRLFNLFLYARIQSPITWDVIAIATDLIFCIVYLFMTHIKDFAKLRDTKDDRIPRWRTKIYTFLAVGYHGTRIQQKLLNSALDIMAAIIIPTTIIAYSLLAWLFGMNLRPGWHSSILAPYFVLTAVYSGICLLIIVMWVYRKSRYLQDYITNKHFNYLGFVMVLLALFYGYFTFSDYITEWYNSEKVNTMLLQKLFSFDHYAWMFIYSTFMAVFIPLFIVGLPYLRSVNNIVITAVFVLVALWFRRYLLIVPPLETSYIPIQDYRPDWVNYSATWVEWALTAAGVAFIILFYMLWSKLAPIIPVSEIEEKSEKLMIFYKGTKE
jgi:molybdopterin-containing oxidoreductase family membrane subunit